MYAGTRVAIIIGEEDDVAAGIVGADDKKTRFGSPPPLS
jgi:hypothetical protein